MCLRQHPKSSTGHRPLCGGQLSLPTVLEAEGIPPRTLPSLARLTPFLCFISCDKFAVPGLWKAAGMVSCLQCFSPSLSPSAGLDLFKSPFLFSFSLLFSAASYNFSFLADLGLEICLSSSMVLPPAVTFHVPWACLPQAYGGVLRRAQQKAAAFSEGGLPPLPNYLLNIPKALEASAALLRRCRHIREHWDATFAASMQDFTLPWAFPEKSYCNSCIRATEVCLMS